MAEDDRKEETELTTDLDEDIAMALVNTAVTPIEDPTDSPEPPSAESEPEALGPNGWTETSRRAPDHGEQSYVGHNRMVGLRTLITGAESGIGRAAAIAFAREGADVAFTYLPENEQDAVVTVQLIEDAGSRALALPGDLQDEEFCQEVIAQTVAEFRGLNVLVNGAGYQPTTSRGIEDLSTEQFDQTFRENVYALFWLTKAALPHLQPGAAIINTSSAEGYHPSPVLIDYAATQAAINSMTFSLAESLGARGIRVNAVAPGAVWTSLQQPAQSAEKPTGFGQDTPLGCGQDTPLGFGQDTPLGRAGQPAELAATYVLLATEDSSYISGSIIGVTGGKHLA